MLQQISNLLGIALFISLDDLESFWRKHGKGTPLPHGLSTDTVENLSKWSVGKALAIEVVKLRDWAPDSGPFDRKLLRLEQHNVKLRGSCSSFKSRIHALLPKGTTISLPSLMDLYTRGWSHDGTPETFANWLSTDHKTCCERQDVPDAEIRMMVTIQGAAPRRRGRSGSLTRSQTPPMKGESFHNRALNIKMEQRDSESPGPDEPSSRGSQSGDRSLDRRVSETRHATFHSSPSEVYPHAHQSESRTGAIVSAAGHAFASDPISDYVAPAGNPRLPLPQLRAPARAASLEPRSRDAIPCYDSRATSDLGRPKPEPAEEEEAALQAVSRGSKRKTDYELDSRSGGYDDERRSGKRHRDRDRSKSRDRVKKRKHRADRSRSRSRSRERKDRYEGHYSTSSKGRKAGTDELSKKGRGGQRNEQQNRDSSREKQDGSPREHGKKSKKKSDLEEEDCEAKVIFRYKQTSLPFPPRTKAADFFAEWEQANPPFAPWEVDGVDV